MSETRQRGFSMVDNILTRDRTFLGIKDPDARWVLVYLHISPNGRNGLVRESVDEIGAATALKREYVLTALADLESRGHIFRDGLYIVLAHWREWQGGGGVHRDGDGKIKVTKAIVADLRLTRAALPDAAFDAYLKASGYATSDALYNLLDRPDPRGGDRKSAEYKAGTGEGRESKADQDSIKTLSKPDQKKSNTKTQTKTQDSDEEEDRPAVGRPSSTTSSSSESRAETAPANLDLLQQGWGYVFKKDTSWRPGPTETGKLESACKLLLRELPAGATPARIALAVAQALLGAKEHGLMLPGREFHLGNLAGPVFAKWLHGNDDKPGWLHDDGAGPAVLDAARALAREIWPGLFPPKPACRVEVLVGSDVDKALGVDYATAAVQPEYERHPDAPPAPEGDSWIPGDPENDH